MRSWDGGLVYMTICVLDSFLEMRTRAASPEPENSPYRRKIGNSQFQDSSSRQICMFEILMFVVSEIFVTLMSGSTSIK